ncbi:Methyltransferase-like protein 7B [Linnemannia zychae]|nr:Methyltransferase-like protein 7B [Linnemannia zychae]
MHMQSHAASLIALVLVSSARADLLDAILPPLAPAPSPPTSGASSTPPTSSSTAPPVSSSSSTAPTTPTPVTPTPNIPTPPPPVSSTGGPIKTTPVATTATTASLTATPTATTPASSGKTETGTTSNNKLATAGIVVAAVVVAVAIGIWVFRKWKLSPSRDFQSKIRGDEYTDNDYPRSYENDTVRLHQMGDQPSEPAAIKSPYNANTAFPQEDHYYDANYASKDHTGYNQSGGYNDYGRGGAPGYDQSGYDHGYNDRGYGHDGYNQSGSYGHDGYSQGGYGGNQGGYNQSGYAPSQVGGGYQHGYDEYGRPLNDYDLSSRAPPKSLCIRMSLLSRFSRTQLIIGGLLTYATGVSAALTFLPSDNSKHEALPSETARQSTFDTMAPGYDKEIGMHEFFLGIQRRRKRLISQAKGRVLEIASGTGRNVDYYTKGCCNEIVFSDFSEGMMKVLQDKVAKSDLGKRWDYQKRRAQQLELERIAYQVKQGQHQEQETADGGPNSPRAEGVVETEIQFKTMNAASIPYPDKSFDTVVDTFGICSFEDPVQTLKEMKRVLKPGGKLLLLEHGNSNWDFMKDMQARKLDRHIHKYGCYWNREIGELVQEAGLKIVEQERSQLGTVFYIIAE